MNRHLITAAISLCTATTLTVSGCAGAGSLGSGDGQTITIAMVSNSQMTDARELSDQFEAQNPGIQLKFVTLSENQARAKITMSTSTGGREFDVVMISNYETPQWAQNGWLTDLEPYIANTPGYDKNDFIPSIRQALSYQDHMYSVPFYGESSFLMYRKDLLEQAGIDLGTTPTWEQVAAAAAKLDAPGMVGICLRGKPGWGEVLAPLDTVINTFGGRWYDEDWNAQLSSPEVNKAVKFYVDLVREYGEPGAAASGFSECATQFSQGRAAMWYDATSAVNDRGKPRIQRPWSAKSATPKLPPRSKPDSGWLYTWSLGIPDVQPGQRRRLEVHLLDDRQAVHPDRRHQLGWERVPPGSRLSTYQIPQYRDISDRLRTDHAGFHQHGDSAQPTVQPVPYTGVQFLTIPEFQDLGTRVSQQVSAAIADQKSVADALEQSQKYAEVVGRSYQEKS